MNIYDKIRSIQEEYFALLDKHFGDELNILRHVPYEDIVLLGEKALEVARRAPLVTLEGQEMPSTTYKAIMLSRDINSFWRQYQKELYEAINVIPHLVLHAKSSFATLLDEVKSTALYLDTIVADDWLYSMREVVEDRERPHQGDLGVSILTEYVRLQSMRQLFLADVVPPILIICPSPHYAERGLRKVSEGISKWLTVQYAGQLFGRGFKDIEDVIEFTSQIRNDSQLARSIADPTLIWEEGASLEAKLKLKLYAAEGAIHHSGLPAELAALSPASALIVHEYAGFDVIAQQEVDDEILGLEPRVSPYHWDGYVWTLGQSAKGQKVREETAVAHVLEQPNFSWLGNVPITKLIEMRTRGSMEEIRSIIRRTSNRLKYASISEFAALSQEVNVTIVAALKDHEKNLKSLIKKEKLGLALDATVLTVVGGLSIASIATPWLGIPATMIGLGPGLGSVRDVVKRLKAIGNIRSEQSRRPIGVLWEAYKNGRP